MPIEETVRSLEIDKLRAAIEKRAGFWKSFQNSIKGSNIGKQLGDGLLAAGTAAAVTVAGVGAKAGFEVVRDRVEKPKAFSSMLEASPGLKKQDPKSVQMTFNTLYSLNRKMAKDPLVAGSFVGRNVSRAEVSDGAGAYVDPQTAKMLMDANPRDGAPVMDAWRRGATQADMYKNRGGKGRGRDEDKYKKASVSGDKLAKFKSQLGSDE